MGRIIKKQIIVAVLLAWLSPVLNAQHNYDNQSVIYSDNGKVGIGTNAPLSNLTVEGTGEQTIAIRSSDAVAKIHFRKYLGGHDGMIKYHTNGRFGFHLDNSSADDVHQNEYMTILNNGYIGVGNNNPTELLDIEGNIELGAGSNALKIKQGDLSFEGSEKPYLYHDGGTNRKIGLGITDDGHVRNYIELYEGNFHTTQYIDFGIQGNSAMRINSQGEVGIATTDFTGNHKLRVEGSIGAREINVEATGWSDFVFDKEYDLPTLEEVEKHITEKGHLPDIPHETEVVENGINLGAMNAKLLQKIEELTLYLIEEHKSNQKLQDEMELLKEKIELLENQ